MDGLKINLSLPNLVLAFKKSTSPYYSKHSKKFVALTMTNDFIDIKVIGHGRGKQPKRRDTKKG